MGAGYSGKLEYTVYVNIISPDMSIDNVVVRSLLFFCVPLCSNFTTATTTIITSSFSSSSPPKTGIQSSHLISQSGQPITV
ncbi:hypothetical protein E2C01_081237 [Portunus trituberculatus]|uniref:Uncharacterized protein n=1 Tax=Portunus trituberculatus TaxID=210409 RepID=A0A5B7ILQ0_PORTR|nr:hypothetical protein [Portunus trituberculatus]